VTRTRRAAVLGLLALGCGAAPARPAAPGVRVTAAVLEWSTGTNQPEGPSPMIETILPAVHDGQEVWRVVHREGDPTLPGGADYDLVDVRVADLTPLRSVTSRDGLRLALTFAGGRAKIDRRSGDEQLTLDVEAAHIVPEGPGQTVWLAAQPLAPGYRASVAIVDRWARDLTDPVRTVDVAVIGAGAVETRMGRCDALEVTLDARDGSFRIRQWVHARPPHYPIRTEYRRGDFFYVSEVVHMVVAGEPPRCAR